MVAAIRPDDVNLALLVHVAGAMILVGGLVTMVAAAALGWRGETAALRLSARTLFAVVLPGWLAMRVGGQWVYSEEKLDDLPDDPAWIGIGFLTADLGFLVLVLALVLAGIGVRRSRTGGGTGLMKASAVLGAVLLAAYLVSVWAMGGKPD